jgi:hypothetical protein
MRGACDARVVAVMRPHAPKSACALLQDMHSIQGKTLQLCEFAILEAMLIRIRLRRSRFDLYVPRLGYTCICVCSLTFGVRYVCLAGRIFLRGIVELCFQLGLRIPIHWAYSKLPAVYGKFRCELVRSVYDFRCARRQYLLWW